MSLIVIVGFSFKIPNRLSMPLSMPRSMPRSMPITANGNNILIKWSEIWKISLS